MPDRCVVCTATTIARVPRSVEDLLKKVYVQKIYADGGGVGFSLPMVRVLAMALGGIQ